MRRHYRDRGGKVLGNQYWSDWWPACLSAIACRTCREQYSPVRVETLRALPAAGRLRSRAMTRRISKLFDGIAATAGRIITVNARGRCRFVTDSRRLGVSESNRCSLLGSPTERSSPPRPLQRARGWTQCTPMQAEADAAPARSPRRAMAAVLPGGYGPPSAAPREPRDLVRAPPRVTGFLRGWGLADTIWTLKVQAVAPPWTKEAITASFIHSGLVSRTTALVYWTKEALTASFIQ